MAITYGWTSVSEWSERAERQDLEVDYVGCRFEGEEKARAFALTITLLPKIILEHIDN